MTGNVVTEGNSLIVYPDRRKMLRRHNTRAVFILLPAALAFFALFGVLRRMLSALVPPFIEIEFAVLPWLIAVFYIVIYFTMVVALRRQNRPIITISPEGLTIHTVLTQFGLLRWDEIAEVRTYNLLYRFVGIVPRDPAALYRRVGRRGLLLRLNSWCVPLYRLFGLFVAPINIPQEYLPVTADELAEWIRAARPGAPKEGVWPPAPGGTWDEGTARR